MGWIEAPVGQFQTRQPHYHTDSESGPVDDHSVPPHLTFQPDGYVMWGAVALPCFWKSLGSLSWKYCFLFQKHIHIAFLFSTFIGMFLLKIYIFLLYTPLESGHSEVSFITTTKTFGKGIVLNLQLGNLQKQVSFRLVCLFSGNYTSHQVIVWCTFW